MLSEYEAWQEQGSLVCDVCGEDGTYQGESFKLFIENAKADGWFVRPSEVHEGVWYHYCSSECFNQFNQES